MESLNTTKKYYVDYTAVHVGAGQHEPVEILSEVEVAEDVAKFEGNDLLAFEDAVLELLDERYDQLAALDEERRVLLAEIRALEGAESFDEYELRKENFLNEEES